MGYRGYEATYEVPLTLQVLYVRGHMSNLWVRVERRFGLGLGFMVFTRSGHEGLMLGCRAFVGARVFGFLFVAGFCFA